MKARRIGIALLLLLPVLTGAAAEKSFLWELKTPAGNCYLLGSVHVLKQEYYPLRPVIETAFAGCEALAVEVDLSPEKIMPAGMKMLDQGMCKGEETIKDHLTPEAYTEAEKAMKAMGLDISGFLKFKPWMLASLIQQKELGELGFDANYGIDLYFLKQAAGKKEILELEGVDFQLGLFAGLTKEESSGFLLSTLLEVEKMGEATDVIIRAWLAGDTEAMAKIVLDDIKSTPELLPFFKKLVDDRNRRMADRIVEYIDARKKFFVVVGAMHLIGEQGIVRLLHDRGFFLRQL